MTRRATWLAAAVFLCPLVAQDPTPPPAQRPDAKARLTELEAEFNKIVTEWRAAQQEAAKAAQKAPADGKPIPAMSMRPDLSGLVAKYLAAADEFRGDDAVQFLMPAMNFAATPAERKPILDRILADHLDSDAVGELGGILQYMDQIAGPGSKDEVFAKIEKHGKNKRLLAWVAFAKSSDTLKSSAPTSKEFQDAKKAAMAAAEKAGDEELTSQIESLVTEQEKFGHGMAAPDIAGKDLDGVDFKLSDYKGKVLFVDFWGDW